MKKSFWNLLRPWPSLRSEVDAVFGAYFVAYDFHFSDDSYDGKRCTITFCNNHSALLFSREGGALDVVLKMASCNDRSCIVSDDVEVWLPGVAEATGKPLDSAFFDEISGPSELRERLTRWLRLCESYGTKAVNGDFSEAPASLARKREYIERSLRELKRQGVYESVFPLEPE